MSIYFNIYPYRKGYLIQIKADYPCYVADESNSGFDTSARTHAKYFEDEFEAYAFAIDNYDEIAASVFEILQNEKLKKKKRKIGFLQAQKFSWERAAFETMESFKKIIK